MISAKLQREKATAIKNANDEAKYERICKLVDEIADMVWEMVEQRIENAANTGKTSTTFVLGLRCISYSYDGLVADAYKAIEGRDFKVWCWEDALRSTSNKSSRGARFANKKWNEQVAELLRVLGEKGYVVECRTGDPHAYRDYEYKPTPENLVDNRMTIKW